MERKFSKSDLKAQAKEFLQSKSNLAQFAFARSLPYNEFKHAVQELVPGISAFGRNSDVRHELINSYCEGDILADEFCEANGIDRKRFQEWLSEARLTARQRKVIRIKQIVQDFQAFDGTEAQFASTYKVNLGTLRKALRSQ